MGAALADVAVSADYHYLAGDHDVGRPFDAVGQRLAASVEVVELAFGYRVVDVHGGHAQLAALVHLVEEMDTGSGLFRQAADVAQQMAIPFFVYHRGQVAAIVDDHVQRFSIGKEERLLDAPVVVGVGLTLPGVDWHTGSGDRGSGVILGRKLVATAPLDFRTQLAEGLY